MKVEQTEIMLNMKTHTVTLNIDRRPKRELTAWYLLPNFVFDYFPLGTLMEMKSDV